jgi:glycosyltransferase involved in cell wall biosynthesis
MESSQRLNFIVETFFPLFEQFPIQRLFLITDKEVVNDNFKRTEVIVIKPAPKNPLLKRLWIEKTLMGLLKKVKADIFISANNFCSLKALLPQYILLPNLEKIKLPVANKAQRLIVLSKSDKKQLLDKLKIQERKIAVVDLSPGKAYKQIKEERKEIIKNKYCEGKEYFLSDNRFQNQGDIINLLKSFSHFKKRQQSSFKLLMMTWSGSPIEESIETYKYRNDVVIIESVSKEEEAEIMATTYAFVVNSDTNKDMITVLNAMKSGVPIIAIDNSYVKEVVGDAALYSANDIKDIGEKMMQLYKDENLRSDLIKKGKEIVKNYTEEKSAAQLWRSITEALN